MLHYVGYHYTEYAGYTEYYYAGRHSGECNYASAALLSAITLSVVMLSIVYSLFAYAASQNAEPRYLFVYILSVPL